MEDGFRGQEPDPIAIPRSATVLVNHSDKCPNAAWIFGPTDPTQAGALS